MEQTKTNNKIKEKKEESNDLTLLLSLFSFNIIILLKTFHAILFHSFL